MDRRAVVLVSGLFAVLTVSSGLGFYNLSLYMHVLAQAKSFPVAELSAAVSCYFLVGGVAGLFVGRVLQHADARYLIVFGALLGGGAIAAIGAAATPWQIMLLYGTFGVGNTCVGLLPATTLVTRWFDARRRAVALSITSTGLSLGGVLFTPLSAALFERLDVAHAMPLLGLAYCVGIGPVAWLTVRSFPDGRTQARGAASAFPGTPFGVAVRSRFFVVLTAAYLLLMGSQVGGIAHLYNRGSEIAAPLDAAFGVSVLAMLSITGRLLGGWLLSRVSVRGFTLLNVTGQAAGLMLVALATARDGLWLGAVVFGFTVGNLLMLQPLILAQAFGLRDYPRVFSLSQALTTLGVASGPLAMGLVRTALDYEVAFVSVACASVVSFALIVAAGPIPRPAAE